ncbi:MAG: TetR/AcrR family transcriptional regulator [Acidimicrobiales bacterium]
MARARVAETEPRRQPGRAGSPAEGRELRSRGQRTVRNLLDAGFEVFAKRGYHPARVDDIVKVAKTSHGTFYLYFASKEDLFRALALDVSDELTALVDELGELRPTPAGKAHLRAWLVRFEDLYRAYGPIIRTWTESEIDTSDTGRLATDMLGRFSSALADRIGRVKGLAADPLVTGLAVVAMIERFSFFVLSGQARAPDDAAVDTLTEVIWAALFGPTRRRSP